jgi:hypothetical protein
MGAWKVPAQISRFIKWVRGTHVVSHKVTAREMGQALLESALESVRMVDESLARHGMFERHAEVRHSGRYTAELLLFAVAPMDYMLTDMSESWAPRVRAAMREALVDRILGEPESQPQSRSWWRVAMTDRLGRYGSAARVGDLTGVGDSALEALGLHRDLIAEATLVTAFIGALNAWSEVIEACEIVD